MLGPKREHKPAKKRWQLELEEEKDPQASPTKEEKEELERLAADEDVADDAANDAGENAEAGQEEDEPKKDVSNEENQPEIEDQSKKRKHFAWMDEDDEELYGDEDSQPEEDEVDAHDNNDKTPAAASGDKDELDQVRFAFVSNISFDARLEDLKVFFQSCGPILSIVPDPHQSNTSSVPSNPKFAKADHKGRAYVEFRTYQALRQALELDEQKFMGRPLRYCRRFWPIDLMQLTDT